MAGGYEKVFSKGRWGGGYSREQVRRGSRVEEVIFANVEEPRCVTGWVDGIGCFDFAGWLVTNYHNETAFFLEGVFLFLSRVVKLKRVSARS